ncbi:MAG: hypothetical protein EKK40_12925 [Bradyrhizobiaceae bacterium]|nr:MAG: hypothetical protein EKK40_12925 [Bradyrhizobiaceae bacterium]
MTYRTLHGWAIGTLLEAGAITECEHHGYMKDRSDPHSWERAKAIAAKERFNRTTRDDRLKAIDDVMRSIGDTCPECEPEREEK